MPSETIMKDRLCHDHSGNGRGLEDCQLTLILAEVSVVELLTHAT